MRRPFASWARWLGFLLTVTCLLGCGPPPYRIVHAASPYGFGHQRRVAIMPLHPPRREVTAEKGSRSIEDLEILLVETPFERAVEGAFAGRLTVARVSSPDESAVLVVPRLVAVRGGHFLSHEQYFDLSLKSQVALRVRIVAPGGRDYDEIEINATNKNVGYGGIERAAEACGEAVADRMKKLFGDE